MPKSYSSKFPRLMQRSMTVMGIGVLASTLFISALFVVYYKHLSRQLFIKLQQLQQEVESLQLEWSQLLLEQATWAADGRIERLAREKLQMRLPEPNEVVVVKE